MNADIIEIIFNVLNKHFVERKRDRKMSSIIIINHVLHFVIITLILGLYIYKFAQLTLHQAFSEMT